MRLVANTSYFSRKEISGYEGTLYDLSYYQGLGWPNAFNTGATLVALSYVNAADYPLIDTDGVHLPAGFTDYRSPATIQNQQQSITQEIRLESTDSDSRFVYTVGGFWQLAREYSLEEIHDPMADTLLQGIFGPGATSLNIFGAATLQNGDGYYNRNIAHDRQLAAFGELSYRLTDELKVTAGGRYSKSSFDLSHFADGPLNFGQTTSNAAASESKFTPKLGMSWQATPADLYYLTYSNG